MILANRIASSWGGFEGEEEEEEEEDPIKGRKFIASRQAGRGYYCLLRMNCDSDSLCLRGPKA